MGKSKRKNKFRREDYYNRRYAIMLEGKFGKYHRNKGATNAFVDVETEDVVYEGEWATKSYEAIGQALWYHSFTGKTPGIIFYVKKRKHLKYVERARRTLDNLNIKYEMIVCKLYLKRTQKLFNK